MATCVGCLVVIRQGDCATGVPLLGVFLSWTFYEIRRKEEERRVKSRLGMFTSRIPTQTYFFITHTCCIDPGHPVGSHAEEDGWLKYKLSGVAVDD